MLIMSLYDSLINTDYVEKMYIGGSRDVETTIHVELKNGSSTGIAKYSKREMCRYVIGMIAEAWSGGDGLFEVPNEREVVARMALARSAGVHVKTKETRYGGS